MATEKKRLVLTRKNFRNTDGTETRSPKENWTHLVYELLGNERDDNDRAKAVHTVAIPREDFPASVLDMAAGHGLAQKIADDAFNKIADRAAADNFTPDATTGYADYLQLSLEDTVSNLRDGVWVEERESGAANVRDLVEAICRAWKDRDGTVADDETRAKLLTSMQNDETRKAVKATPDVAAHLAQIEADKKIARAKALAKEAKANKPSEGFGALIA